MKQRAASVGEVMKKIKIDISQEGISEPWGSCPALLALEAMFFPWSSTMP